MQHGALSVLVVSQFDDPHADVVEAQLSSKGTISARTSLNSLADDRIEWSSNGDLSLTINKREWSIGEYTTVWWRRPGWFDNSALQIEELELARYESAVILPGALDAAGVTWVDQPWTMMRAANRLVQLRLASELGVHFPLTTVTIFISSCGKVFRCRGDRSKGDLHRTRTCPVRRSYRTNRYGPR